MSSGRRASLLFSSISGHAARNGSPDVASRCDGDGERVRRERLAGVAVTRPKRRCARRQLEALAQPIGRRQRLKQRGARDELDEWPRLFRWTDRACLTLGVPARTIQHLFRRISVFWGSVALAPNGGALVFVVEESISIAHGALDSPRSSAPTTSR